MPKRLTTVQICQVPKCQKRIFDGDLCRRHSSLFKRGRIDRRGKLLPLTCRKCSRKFHYRKPRHRELCDECRPRPKRTAKNEINQQLPEQSAARLNAIWALRKAGFSMAEIGRRFGITGERIRQIIQ